ncbi:unnamed protein product [Plasmodium vivax]|uniref:(malaria parasite P. vivax) hypothetical protein n=1 Tax=Plasmodium vivax TaxID=5855 RepID=A0A8S4H7J0_PLAVI|nr:unnamed protein product [Plasmodium vivax]
MDYPDLEYYENNHGQKDEIRELLKKLTLYNFYKKIDMEFNNDIESEKCDICNKRINNLANAQNELIKLCKAVCNFILNNNFEQFCEGNSCESSCFNMKFRLYVRVMEINQNPDNIKSFFDALQIISNDPDARLKLCKITNINLNKNDLTHYKYLYEFISTFFDIRYKISEEYNSEDKLYCKHIKEFFRFYNSTRKNCSSKSTCIYYDILYTIKTKLITSERLKFIYENCKYVKTECPRDTNIYDDIPCLKDKEEISKMAKANSDEKNDLNILYTAAIPVISISTIFYIFYKFTPLGFWLCSKVRRKKNIPSPINEEKYHPSYDINFKTKNPDSRKYNIQYQ